MCIRTAALNSLFLPEPFWGSSHGYPIDTDFICLQAFGRNSCADENLPHIRETRDSTGNDIAMFQWLRSSQFDPGGPNTLLAIRCIKLAKLGRFFFDKKNRSEASDVVRPVIGQWEILYAMYLEEPDWYQENEQRLFPLWPPAQESFNTRVLMLIAKDIAESHDLYNPLIVAHPEHIQRCFFIARKIFRGSIAIDHDWNTGQEWFDKQSVQPWTRTPKAWLVYELCARIHHRLHGWM